jgi:hypothetical protein
MISMVGVTIAWSNDAEARLRGLLFPLVMLTVPIVGAATAFRSSDVLEIAEPRKNPARDTN